MKVIQNIELLKKLQPYLEDIKTEYYYCLSPNDEWGVYKGTDESPTCIEYKTLNLEEALDLLPYKINKYLLQIQKRNLGYWIEYQDTRGDYTYLSDKSFDGKTLLESIEQMLEYLIDNNLLGA